MGTVGHFAGWKWGELNKKAKQLNDHFKMDRTWHGYCFFEFPDLLPTQGIP